MSKKNYMQKVAEAHWMRVLSDNKHKFTEIWSQPLMKKLKQVGFTKQGDIKTNTFGSFALAEFPSLVDQWKERMNGKNNA